MKIVIGLMLILYLASCLFLIFVILIQSGDKGGGLSSLGSSTQGLSDALGATGAEKTLNKMTTFSAVAFMLLAFGLSFAISKVEMSSEKLLPDEPPAQPPIMDTNVGAGAFPGDNLILEDPTAGGATPGIAPDFTGSAPVEMPQVEAPLSGEPTIVIPPAAQPEPREPREELPVDPIPAEQ